MRITTLILLSLLAATSVAKAQIFSNSVGPSTASTAATLKNATTALPAESMPTVPTIGGAFSLLNQNGATITDANFRNSFMLITFGYTRCGAVDPDSCSPAPAAMMQALAKLTEAQANRIMPVFVTLDPTRDDPATLKAFLARYGNRMIGLTGSPGEIDRMARSYSVYYQGVGNPDLAIERALSPQDLAAYRHDPDYRPAGGEAYTIDHSQFIYLMGPDGQLVTVFNGSLPIDNIVQGLTTAVK